MQCLETHAERIDEHEPADKSFAETGDFADHFQRHHRAKDARQGAEHACRGTGGHRPFWRRFRIKTAVSWIGFAGRTFFIWAQNCQRAVEGAYRGGDQWTLFVKAGIRHGIASDKIVRAIGNDVERSDHRAGVVRSEPCAQRGNLDMRI